MKIMGRSVTPVCVLVLFAGAASAAPSVRGGVGGVGGGSGAEFSPLVDGQRLPVVAAANVLYLRSGVVTTGAKLAAAETLRVAKDRMVLQLDGPLTKDRAERLEAAGVRLGQYLPTNAFLVETAGVDAAALDAIDFVRWHGRYEKAWKMAAAPEDREFATPERKLIAERGECVMVLSLFADAEADRTLEALGAMPGMVVQDVTEMGGNVTLTVVAPKGQTALLMDLEDVLAIEEAPEATPRMATSTWVVQSNIAGFTPLHDNGLTGEGQIVSVIDLPVDDDNCVFRDETAPAGSQFDKWVAILDNASGSSHGTAVCSMIAGDGGVAGSENGDLRGIAYDARMVFNRIPSFTESALISDFEAAHDLGARIHSNSWGEDASSRNFYNVWARAIDVFTREHEDDLVVFAATNLSVLRTPENSRNVLATGASYDTPLQTDHRSGGIGPTGDGRRKPELYAPGSSVRAAQPNLCSATSTGVGTSFACPQIAAGGALIREYFMEGYYPGGSAGSGSGFTPTGALLKATLLNSGVDMTGESGYPTFLEGWGRALLDEALHFAGETRTLLVRDVRNSSAESMTTGESYAMEFEVTGAGEKLKATLVYTDVPAAPSAVFVPVNDLDLELESPTGVVYKGNVFVNGLSATGGSADDLNNVEQVHLESPETGTWTVRVLATAVNAETQGFALALTGEVAEVSQGCVADVDGSGEVNSVDLALLLAAWGSGDPTANLNGLGVVDGSDLAVLLAAWGPCP